MIELRRHDLLGDPGLGRDRGVIGRVEPLAVPHQRPAEAAQDPLLLLGELRRDPQLARRERHARARSPPGRRTRSRSARCGRRSPSVSRRRPWIRSPLTKVPFCEKPSSHSVQSPALNSSSACRRETSGSHGERHVGLLAPPDGDRARARVQRDDLLHALVVAQEQERRAALLRLAPRLQVRGRRQIECQWGVHHPRRESTWSRARVREHAGRVFDRPAGAGLGL